MDPFNTPLRHLQESWRIQEADMLLENSETMTKLAYLFNRVVSAPLLAVAITTYYYQTKTVPETQDQIDQAAEYVQTLPPEQQDFLKRKTEQLIGKIEKAVKSDDITAGYTQDEIDVARVIYSEAGPATDYQERQMVASVMAGRINHSGFGRGKLKTMRDVAFNRVGKTYEFSAVNDRKNKNWAATATPNKLTGASRKAFEEALYMARHAKPWQGRHGPIVYYHTHRIKKPRSWDNKYWKSPYEGKSRWHKYYSVRPS